MAYDSWGGSWGVSWLLSWTVEEDGALEEYLRYYHGRRGRSGGARLHRRSGRRC